MRSASAPVSLDARVDTGAQLYDALHLLLERLLLGGEALQRRLGIADQRALAQDVFGKLNQPPLKLG